MALDQSDHIKQLPLYYINQKKIQFSNILYYYALWYCLSCLRFAFRIQNIFSLNENKLPKYLYVFIIINLIVLNSSPMVLVLSPDSKMVRNIKIGWKLTKLWKLGGRQKIIPTYHTFFLWNLMVQIPRFFSVWFV